MRSWVQDRHRVPVRVTLDDEANAAYIYLVDEIARGGVAPTVTLDHPAAMINLDLDPEGRVLGAGAARPVPLIGRLRGA